MNPVWFATLPSFWFFASSASSSSKSIVAPVYLASGEFWATLLAFVLIATLGVEYLKKWGLIQSKADLTVARLDLVLSVLWPEKTALSESILGKMIDQADKTAEQVEEIYTLSVPAPGKRPPAWCCVEENAREEDATLKAILSEVQTIHRHLERLEARVSRLEARE